MSALSQAQSFWFHHRYLVYIFLVQGNRALHAHVYTPIGRRSASVKLHASSSCSRTTAVCCENMCNRSCLTAICAAQLERVEESGSVLSSSATQDSRPGSSRQLPVCMPRTRHHKLEASTFIAASLDLLAMHAAFVSGGAARNAMRVCMYSGQLKTKNQ